uniref:Uncharacterized protein n=1 Tax=Glossina palpalis gambiensis TaxID=67801 RepID=A0A1B0B2V7_9MUSC
MYMHATAAVNNKEFTSHIVTCYVGLCCVTEKPITTFPYDNNNSFEMFIKSHKKTSKKQDMKF